MANPVKVVEKLVCKNRLLAELPADEYNRVRQHLTFIDLTQGETLFHPETPLEYVYFPETAVLSYVFNTEDGVALEVGTVGRNGLAGVSVALDTFRTPNAVEVLIGGAALRMSAHRLRSQMNLGGALPAMLYRYAQATIVHSGQMQVCGRLHSPAERLAGWLLLIYNLNPPRMLPLTHEAIGQMLGVRRSGVTEVANQLRTQGLITYSRGQIAICDREALTDFACKCVRVISDEYERVFKAQH